MDRRTSVSTEPARTRYLPRSPRARIGVVIGVLALVQAVLFHDHFAVALTVPFALGIGLWLRTWKAAIPAVICFAIAFLLAVATGWLHDARPVWEPLLGSALAALGGLTGGGIFDVLRHDVDARAPAPAYMDPF